MKKWRLVMLLCVVALALTACACKHDETTLVQAADATCTAEGYTGDKVCVKCNEVLEKGTAIPAEGHVSGEAAGVKSATCTEDGYTGDILCITCGEVVEQGEALPATGHMPGERVGVIAATCTQEGYTGDVRCTVCDELLTSGEAVPMAEHVEGGLVNASGATCTQEGYTGDVRCTVCDELLTSGEAVPMVEHVEGGLVNASEPTCDKDGYTGDIVCANCAQVLKPGEAVPALGHQWSEPVNASEATCLRTGWTGECECTVCKLVQPNTEIPMLAEHPFDENGVCTACGWMKPGLYVDDALVMSWADMETNGYAVVDEGKLVEIKGNMQMGKLVVGEDVTYLHGNLYKGVCNDTLKEVWLPRSVTEMNGPLLYENASVTDVRLFCQLETLQLTFQNAQALECVVLPQSLRSLNNDCFVDTPALREVNLPEGLEYIGSGCFYCSGIESLTLPKTLNRIDQGAFRQSGLKEIVLPASLTRLQTDTFSGCEQLIKVDMSACELITDMGINFSTFSNCPALTEILLPPNLVKFASSYGMLKNATSLKHIAFPEGFTTLAEGEFENTPIESVVWPMSLIEAGGLANCPLKTIYYRGSEAQWKMTTASTLFPEATVICNYTGE